MRISDWSSNVCSSDLAYDTWLHATKDWSRFRRWRAKSLMMLLVTSRFWPKRVKGMKALLKQDGLTGWRVTARIWWYLLGTPGVLRKSFFPWLSYFMPGFHPWNHDRSEEHTSELQSLMRTSYAV